jgi:small GTP-binding protein
MSKVIKIAILGSGGVGKSSILLQFVQDHFIEYYDPTIEDFTRKQIYLQGNHYLLEILDTAGQEEYYVLMDQYLNYGDGFLMVYDINNESSFEKIKNFKEKIDRIQQNPKLVLAGNKCESDLRRMITYSQGDQLANEWNCKFFECSAKKRINIDILFHTLVLEIEKDENRSKKFNKRSSSTKMVKYISKCNLL